jgi:amino acid transporter
MEETTGGAPVGDSPKLKRTTGLWMATALVVGSMIGSGVFLTEQAAIHVLITADWGSP